MTRMAMWHRKSEIDLTQLTRRKVVLVAVIAITSVLPLLFVQPDDAPLGVNIIKYLAKTGAFVGSMLLIWQFLLGFRGAVSAIFPDLTWVVDLHKKLGMYGVPIIVLHPVFIAIYYAAQRDTNLFALDLADGFSWFVLLGIVTLAVIAFIVVTSIWFRDRLGFGRWLSTHLASYVVPPFLFVHSFVLGPTIDETPLRFYWWFFAAVIALLYVHRLLHALGVTLATHRVASAREVGDSTTEILMEPTGDPLEPAPGQFVYLRRAGDARSHPYTVSAAEVDGRLIGVTVKAEGEQSTALQDAGPGDHVLLDGPYGVFTRPAAASGQPLVLIAGGIGITPFRRLWQSIERDGDREAHLFSANDKLSDIAYRDELDALEHVRVVHVLADEPDYDGETGHVDVDLLRKHLSGDLDEYQFLICGPPPMILSLDEELDEAGVPSDQIRHELFAS